MKMSDVSAGRMKYLELISIGAGPDLVKGMMTVTFAMKDDHGGTYFTHLVTRHIYAYSTQKTLVRMRGVKIPPAPEPGNGNGHDQLNKNPAGPGGS
jgi:hypothetical protein